MPQQQRYVVSLELHTLHTHYIGLRVTSYYLKQKLCRPHLSLALPNTMACLSAQVVFTPLLIMALLLYGFRPVLAQPGQDYLAGHNAARDLVGVPHLNWDATVASYAQNYSDAQLAAGSCRQLLPSHGPYGENKFWGGPGKVWTAADAVQTWVSVGKFYNAATNTCAAGQQCGEYTQVVWRNTTGLGCGTAVCSDNSTFIMCSYSPPGNIVGQRAF